MVGLVSTMEKKNKKKINIFPTKICVDINMIVISRSVMLEQHRLRPTDIVCYLFRFFHDIAETQIPQGRMKNFDLQ